MEIGRSNKLTRLWLHTNVEDTLREPPFLNVELSVNVLVSVDGEFCGICVVFAGKLQKVAFLYLQSRFFEPNDHSLTLNGLIRIQFVALENLKGSVGS